MRSPSPSGVTSRTSSRVPFAESSLVTVIPVGKPIIANVERSTLRGNESFSSGLITALPAVTSAKSGVASGSFWLRMAMFGPSPNRATDSAAVTWKALSWKCADPPPVPMSMESWPPPVYTMSLPAPALICSCKLVPQMTSSPSVPVTLPLPPKMVQPSVMSISTVAVVHRPSVEQTP